MLGSRLLQGSYNKLLTISTDCVTVAYNFINLVNLKYSQLDDILSLSNRTFIITCELIYSVLEIQLRLFLLIEIFDH